MDTYKIFWRKPWSDMVTVCLLGPSGDIITYVDVPVNTTRTDAEIALKEAAQLDALETATFVHEGNVPVEVEAKQPA